MATRNSGNPRAQLVTLSNNRCPLFRSAPNRLPTLKAISIIKYQITSKISGDQILTSDQNPIPWGVRTAYLTNPHRHVQLVPKSE